MNNSILNSTYNLRIYLETVKKKLGFSNTKNVEQQEIYICNLLLQNCKL